MEHRPTKTPFYAPIGVGLRAPHIAQVLQDRPAVDFFEVHPENYILDRASLGKLEEIRKDYPLSLHAVGLSLGSADGIDPNHLAALGGLVNRLDPFLLSDHLSWSVADGAYLNDLLPLPYTAEALDIVARNIDLVQTVLKRTILIENPSAYMAFQDSELEEPEFLRRLVARTGCGLLLDVNNVYVSATNLGFDAKSYLASFPFEAVREIHLAGHTRKDIEGETVLIDDHGGPVGDAVLRLYATAIAEVKESATLIEWDSNIPEFDVLLRQRDNAARVAQQTHKAPQPAPLKTLQAQMSCALLSHEEKPLEAAFSGHFSIYRNNVRESLVGALRTVYQGVAALVGDDFFRQTALQFIQINPPRMPSIAGYGAEFAEFLEGLPSCRSLPYLGDVARLEWNLSRATLACPVTALSPDALRGYVQRGSSALCFSFQSGIAYLDSRFPIDEIWQFARAGGVGSAPELDGNAARLEISRTEDGGVIRRLSEAEFRFRNALHEGADLEGAAEQANAADIFFDLAMSLRSALQDGIFIDCQSRQSQFEEVRSCLH